MKQEITLHERIDRDAKNYVSYLTREILNDEGVSLDAILDDYHHPYHWDFEGDFYEAISFRIDKIKEAIVDGSSGKMYGNIFKPLGYRKSTEFFDDLEKHDWATLSIEDGYIVGTLKQYFYHEWETGDLEGKSFKLKKTIKGLSRNENGKWVVEYKGKIVHETDFLFEAYEYCEFLKKRKKDGYVFAVFSPTQELWYAMNGLNFIEVASTYEAAIHVANSMNYKNQYDLEPLGVFNLETFKIDFFEDALIRRKARHEKYELENYGFSEVVKTGRVFAVWEETKTAKLYVPIFFEKYVKTIERMHGSVHTEEGYKFLKTCVEHNVETSEIVKFDDVYETIWKRINDGELRLEVMAGH